MGVEPCLRASVEPAYRYHARYRSRGVENLEAQTRALPAGELSSIERCDLAAVGRDEIVVEVWIVELDRVEQIAAGGVRRNDGDQERRGRRKYESQKPVVQSNSLKVLATGADSGRLAAMRNALFH